MATFKFGKPPSLGLRVLYLDFDGVLHHENCFYRPRRGPYLIAPPGHTVFQHLKLLESLLEPYPDVRIVLSTSWVRQYGFRRTAKFLGPTLQARAIGATFHTAMGDDAFGALDRGLQIVRDVVSRKPLDWLAIDDDAQGWPAWCLDKLVHTDGEMGIGEPRVMTQIQSKLAAMSAPSGEQPPRSGLEDI
ncbi:MAG: HAD domain-containing protein [Burkholderiaceae bacterium]|nr:HAD domain-containing protein [Burkholderiaceae bacterium]